MDHILEKCKNNTPPQDMDFLINFCLLDQAQANPHSINVCYTMFETDKICQGWVEAAKRLDLIVVPSEFNRITFTQSGIPEHKVIVCPCPMDLDEILNSKPIGVSDFYHNDLNNYKHRFLNVSEYITRKNIDTLISTWVKSVKNTDNACLLLKLSANSGLKTDCIKEKIDKLTSGNPNAAPIFLITEQLTEAQMLGLYNWCTHYVSCSFGEGWGLGESTAGLLGKYVIAPDSSAFTQYLNNNNAYLIKTNKLAAKQEGPTAQFYEGHCWFAPVVFNLRSQFQKSIIDANNNDLSKPKALVNNIKQMCDSRVLADGLVQAIKKHPFGNNINEPLHLKEPDKFNLVMHCKTLQTKCGIADYTVNLYKGIIQSTPDIQARSLLSKADFFELPMIINQNNLDIVNIQLEYQFSSPKRLEHTIKYLQNSRITPIITMHTVNPQAYDYHKVLIDTKCPIIVSAYHMRDQLLHRCGFINNNNNIYVLPMGIDESQCVTQQKQSDKFRFGFFGFGYFHKGIDKLLSFMNYTHNKGHELLILSTKPENDRGYFDSNFAYCKELSQKFPNQIAWNINYISEEEIVKNLSTCDLIVLPYSEYGGFGVSAAVRTCLKAGVPIVTFKNNFFQDLKEEKMIQYISDESDYMIPWMYNLINRQDIEGNKFFTVDQFLEKRKNYLSTHNWVEIGRQYVQICHKAMQGIV
jgi:glycosyltransferase involved in cell wall biosynthesis